MNYQPIICVVNGVWREVRAPARGVSVDTQLARHQQLCDAAARVPIASALLAPVLAVLNMFNTNHHTVGDLVPHAQLKILCAVAGTSPPDRGSNGHREITSLFRVACHPVSSPFVLSHLFGMRVANADHVPAESAALPSTVLDAWLNVRRPSLPSGVRKLAIFAAAAAILADDGILPFHPSVAAITTIKIDPARYHIGASFLTDQARECRFDSLIARVEAFFPDLAYYLQQADRGASILQSPAMRHSLRTGTAMTWRALVTQWLSVASKGISTDLLKGATECMGAGSGTNIVTPDTAHPDVYYQSCIAMAERLHAA